ncbi:hypothetical protein ES703_77892 [subsurface metagenome]
MSKLPVVTHRRVHRLPPGAFGWPGHSDLPADFPADA